MNFPEHYDQAKVKTLANIYFEGRVVSHSVWDAEGRRLTLGVMLPGTYSFTTADPELMEVTAGALKARIKGQDEWDTYQAGQYFRVPANTTFEAVVESAPAQYICTFG
jgi:hypothetical protein